jgi:hypothetical protein
MIHKILSTSLKITQKASYQVQRIPTVITVTGGTFAGVEVMLHAFLTSTVDEGKPLTSCCDRVSQRKSSQVAIDILFL